MRYARLLCLFCCLYWWDACMPPYWDILGWDDDVLAQTVKVQPIDEAIKECFVMTERLRDLVGYSNQHKEEVAKHYWNIQVLSETAIDLYAKQCAILLQCKEEGVEKHQEHLMVLSHFTWSICVELQSIIKELDIRLEKKRT